MANQNHIHLSSTVAGAPEHAPDKKWAITRRIEIPDVVMSINRTLNGKLRAHVLSNGSGPIQFVNFTLTVKVDARDGDTLDQRVAILKAMHGKVVTFTDLNHPNDGANHVIYNKSVFCQVGEFEKVADQDPALQFFYVDVQLTDNYTV